jgi:DNA-directed RNA polymerase subunit A"
VDYDWPKYIEKRVTDFADKYKLTGKKRNDFVGFCFEEYMDSLIPVHEAAGLLAAHSFGEPATQLILRTKHYAGAAEVSMGSGIERLETLVDAREKTKYPMMTIFIKDEFRKGNKMQDYLKEIIYKIVTDIADVTEDLEKHQIKIDFKDKKLKELKIKRENVIVKLKTFMRFKFEETKKGIVYNFKDVGLSTIRKYFLKIKTSCIKGVDGIQDAIIAEEDGESVINTMGSNLKAMLKLDFVNPSKTYTNNVFEIFKIYGIEAARYMLVKQLYGVYKDSGIAIDSRHLELLVDVMCLEGNVKGVVRTGIIGTKKSPLARAAFEQTEKVLFDVALSGEKEEFKGVVENVMAGLPIKIGVGNVKLKMNFDNNKISAKVKKVEPKKKAKESKAETKEAEPEKVVEKASKKESKAKKVKEKPVKEAKVKAEAKVKKEPKAKKVVKEKVATKKVVAKKKK